MTEQNENLNFWSSAWGYPHAVLVAATLFLNGWIIQVVTATTDVRAPAWPFNLYALAVLWVVLFSVSWKWRKTSFVRWLASTPVSVVSLGFVGGLSLLAGLIPQGGKDWITNITGSWPFAFELLLMLLNLGLATLNRLFDFKWADWGFVANHAGFWIVVAAMAFGSSDIEKLRMTVGEGETSAQAVRMNNPSGEKPIEMPFSITLKQFRMDEYHPRLAFYDAQSANFEMRVLASDLTPGSKFKANDLEIEIEKVLPTAKRTPQGFEPTQEKFAEFALYAKVVNTKTKEVKQSWMAPGSAGISPVTIHTPVGILVLLDPQAKLYRSNVELNTAGEHPLPAQIEVNKPFEFMSWKIYQSSYEVSANRTKFMSIFDLVRDPWLPVVYAGALLMLLGTCHLFWNGVKRHGTAHEDNHP